MVAPNWMTSVGGDSFLKYCTHSLIHVKAKIAAIHCLGKLMIGLAPLAPCHILRHSQLVILFPPHRTIPIIMVPPRSEFELGDCCYDGMEVDGHLTPGVNLLQNLKLVNMRIMTCV